MYLFEWIKYGAEKVTQFIIIVTQTGDSCFVDLRLKIPDYL